METFLGALGVAAITAICIIAYRHPKGYAKLFKGISDMLIWGIFLVFGFAMGVQAAASQIKPYLDPKKVSEAGQQLAAITPDPWITTGIFALAFGFFAFLSVLPQILEHEPQDKIDR